ncbi:MAG: hypothetical protein AAF809_12955 [Bacteroidota bacterium]
MLLRYLAHDVGTVAELMRVERLAGFTLTPDATQSLVDLFLDTEAFRLLEAGFALRLRQHDGAFYGRLRPLSAPSGTRAAAHRQVVPSALPLPLRAENLAPGALQSALQALAGPMPLDLQARVRIERTPRTLHAAGAPVGHFVVDSVVYEWARKRDVVHEVKLLLRERTPHDLERIDAVLSAYGLEPLDPDRYASVVHRLGASATAPLLLMPDERRQLRTLAESEGLVARRAQAILAVAARRTIAEVAQEVGMEPNRVRFWSGRFRWYRLRLFDVGGGRDAGEEQARSASATARPYAQDEVALDAMRSASVRPANPAPTISPLALPREPTGRPAAPARPPREPAPSLSGSGYDLPRPAPQSVSPEAKKLGERDSRGGVLTRVARVVAHRGRGVRERRRSGADTVHPAESPSPYTHGMDAPLSACIAEDVDTALADLRAALAGVETAQADASPEAATANVLPTVVSLAEAARRLEGVLACYAPHMDAEIDALAGRAATVHEALRRVRTWEVIVHLLPEDGDPASQDFCVAVRARRQTEMESLRAAPLHLPEGSDEVHAAMSTASSGDAQPLRLVMASTVWRQYEHMRQQLGKVVLEGGDGSAVCPSEAARTALAGLRHALRRAVGDRRGAHAEVHLLEQALQRGEACAALTEARGALDAWRVDLADQGVHRVVTQRLEAALREESAAWREAAHHLLARPFRNYLGMVVAAL